MTKSTLDFDAVLSLLREGKPVYIKNNSKKTHDIGVYFIVTLDYIDNSGQQTWKVPRNPTPFKITSEIPANALIDSRDFRDNLNSEMLLALSEEDAKAEMTEDAVEAWGIANMEANKTHRHRAGEAKAAREANRESATAATQNPAYALSNLGSNVQNVLGASVGPQVPQHNIRVTTLAKRLAQGESIPEKDLLRDLKGIVGDLSAQDLSLVAGNGLFPQAVRKWAADAITSL